MKKSKKATVGEKIVLKHLFNIRADDPNYDNFLDDVRDPSDNDPVYRQRDSNCARAIDAAVMRAVKEAKAKAVPRAWEGGIHHERHMARQEKWATDAANELKKLVEAETGVTLK